MKLFSKRPIRSKAGYEWVRLGEIEPDPRYPEPVDPGLKDLRKDELLLVARPTRDGPGAYEYESYDPPPDLFRRFAELDLTLASIQSFADQFGGLRPHPLQVNLPGHGLTDINAEFFDDWASALREFKPAYLIWQALARAERGETQRLQRFISWSGRRSGKIVTVPQTAQQIKGLSPLGHGAPNRRLQLEDLGRDFFWPGYGGQSTRAIQSQIESIVDGDIFRPARLCIADLIESHLRGRLNARFSFDDKGELDLGYQPDSLLSLIWTQLGESASKFSRMMPCRNPRCGELMFLDTQRSHIEFHSDKCRMAMYEERKREAINIWKNNPRQAFDSIAAELGVHEASTVKKWIARHLNARERISPRSIARRMKLRESDVKKLLEKPPRRRSRESVSASRKSLHGSIR